MARFMHTLMATGTLSQFLQVGVTCLEFIATQCSVYVVAGILLSTSKDSPVRCIISSLTLNAILELNFVQCPCNSFCDSIT